MIEVYPRMKSEVMSGKYIIQYLFGAGSSAAIVPLIDAIGVGLTFTISEYLVSSHFLLILSMESNEAWQASFWWSRADVSSSSLRDGDWTCSGGRREGLSWRNIPSDHGIYDWQLCVLLAWGLLQ